MVAAGFGFVVVARGVWAAEKYVTYAGDFFRRLFIL
jgi:hypothetical protein